MLLQNPALSAPAVSFSATVQGLSAKFESSSEAKWDLGDGSRASGKTLQHRYQKHGDYTVTMLHESGQIQGVITTEDDRELLAVLDKKLPAETVHVVNPYAGADKYINPDYAKSVMRSVEQTPDVHLAAKMRGIIEVPTAVWLDRIEAIQGGIHNDGRTSLENHFLGALAQQRKGIPMLIELVIYNLPDRDCASLSSNGTLTFEKGGIQTYKKYYIDVIAGLIEDPRFASLRFSLILEPDSLPNMVTNLAVPKCATVAKNNVYVECVQYAIERLSGRANTYIYLDTGHSGWLGWENNLKATVQYFASTLSKLGRGLSAIDGFVSNTSNFTPTEEVFLTSPDQHIAGKPVKSSGFYNWNPDFSEKKYIESFYQASMEAGFSREIKFLIDTSRNGWGGPQRPVKASDAADLESYVDRSRIDRRAHRGNWCNPEGAGAGHLPMAEPYGPEHPVAAFSWIKAPGESDGSSDPAQAGADNEGKSFDKMCDPGYIVPGTGKPTGAMPHAPAAGHWFYPQFAMLVGNAHPPLKEIPQRKMRSFPVFPQRVSYTYATSGN